MNLIKVKAKRAFTRTKIPGADYVINQYVGCQHACSYCYAKFMERWYPYGEWGSWIVVKENLPELVKNEKVTGKVYMNSVSDPYQPIEKEIKLTRRILENIDKKIELSILTKSSLVLRDIDLFKKFRNIEVGLTINGFDRGLKREVEPYSTENVFRIEALKKLKENGIITYAFISPIIPKLINVKRLIEETRSFVDFYWFEFLNLKASGTKFVKWLKQNYPESYETMINKDKFQTYINDVRELINESGISVRGIVTHNIFKS